jgi:hypothetical protein
VGFLAAFGLGKRPVWLVGRGTRTAATPVAANATHTDGSEQLLVLNRASKIPG